MENNGHIGIMITFSGFIFTYEQYHFFSLRFHLPMLVAPLLTTNKRPKAFAVRFGSTFPFKVSFHAKIMAFFFCSYVYISPVTETFVKWFFDLWAIRCDDSFRPLLPRYFLLFFFVAHHWQCQRSNNFSSQSVKLNSLAFEIDAGFIDVVKSKLYPRVNPFRFCCVGFVCKFLI